MRKDIDVRKDEIIEWLESGISRAEVCLRLRCKYDTLKARLDKWGCQELKNQSGKNRPRYGARRPTSDYLTLEGLTISSAKLKARLFRDGYKERRCENPDCGITEWNGKDAPLELDHVNGNRFDNRLSNLKILCANCHAQQPTNAGKNRGRYTKTARSIV